MIFFFFAPTHAPLPQDVTPVRVSNSNLDMVSLDLFSDDELGPSHTSACVLIITHAQSESCMTCRTTTPPMPCH